MSITYQELNTEVQALQSKILKVEIVWDVDAIDEEMLESVTESIKEIKDETKRIIYFSTMMQINPELKEDDYDIDIPAHTQLTAETLFGISSDLETFKKQNILLDLIYRFLDENDDDVFNSILEKYDLWGMEKLVEFIQSQNLISTIGEQWALKFIIAQVICWIDLYVAIEKTLWEYGIDTQDSNVMENVGYPQGILDYVEAFNALILSKMWINYTTPHSPSTMLN